MGKKLYYLLPLPPSCPPSEKSKGNKMIRLMVKSELMIFLSVLYCLSPTLTRRYADGGGEAGGPFQH